MVWLQYGVSKNNSLNMIASAITLMAEAIYTQNYKEVYSAQIPAADFRSRYFYAQNLMSILQKRENLWLYNTTLSKRGGLFQKSGRCVVIIAKHREELNYDGTGVFFSPRRAQNQQLHRLILQSYTGLGLQFPCSELMGG